MGLIPADLKAKIEALLGNTMVNDEDHILYQQLSFTGMPQDEFITSAYVRRAKAEAESLPQNYKCFACGRTYDDRNEFVACMQDHTKDFMAGLPIDRLPEFEEEMLARLPPEIRAAYYKSKRDDLTPQVTPENQE